MAFLEVLRAGPMVSVQDRGRFGLLGFGVSASGPMDGDYLAIANALVANHDNEAALEFAALGGVFRADADVLVAVVADGCTVTCAGRPLPIGESRVLPAGETLQIGAVERGVWGYLAIAGGIAVPAILGSRATHLRSAIGGLAGRRLIDGDRLPLAPTGASGCLELRQLPMRGTAPIRVVPGPQDDHFDAAAWQRFTTTRYTVSVRSDRMGMQLQGAEIPSHRGHDIISDMTPMGAVQIPGSGQPVILLAERQPTGGYPKIATIISADLHRLAQKRPGETVTFAPVGQSEAEALFLAAGRQLQSLLAQVRAPRTLSEILTSENLIGGVWAD